MKTKIFIHPKYKNIEHVIYKIPQLFDDIGETLLNDRNVVKVLKVDNIKIVIKQFKKITFANRIIYRFFRKSKAERSYHIAEELLRKGINTPFPIAYIDEYRSFTLRNSYFISAFVDGIGLNKIDLEVHNQNFIVSLAHFLYSLHEQHVFHQDLNTSNIMVKMNKDETYEFYLIDNNRMRFHEPNKKRVIKNLHHLGAMPLWAFMILVDTYAELAEVKSYKLAFKLLMSKRNNQAKRSLKTTLKTPLKYGVSFFKKIIK